MPTAGSADGDKKLNKPLTAYDGSMIILAAFIAGIGGSVLVQYVIATASGSDALSAGAIYAINALLQLFIFCAAFFYMLSKGRNPFHYARMNVGMKPKNALLLVPVTLFSMMAFLPLALSFSIILEMLGFNMPTGVSLEGQVHPAGIFFINLFAMVLLPSLMEEFVFTGVAANAYKARGFIFAAIISSVLFGIFHFSAVQFVHQILLSIVICYVFFITRSFWAAFLVHAANNLFVLLISYIPAGGNAAPQGLSVFEYAAVFAAFILISILGVFLLAACLHLLTERMKKQRAEERGVGYYRATLWWNVTNANLVMKGLFETDEEFKCEVLQSAVREKRLELAEHDPGLQEYLAATFEEEKLKQKRRDNWGLAAVFSVMGALWLVLFITGFFPA